MKPQMRKGAHAPSATCVHCQQVLAQLRKPMAKAAPKVEASRYKGTRRRGRGFVDARRLGGMTERFEPRFADGSLWGMSVRSHP